MTPKVYRFSEKYAEGEVGEALLDRMFGEDFTITPVDRDGQRMGTDRVFQHRDGRRFTVEYKSDNYLSGNFFIETWSVFEQGKRGWFYTSRADFLVYYYTQDRACYILPMDDLRALVASGLYPEVEVKNVGYTARGLLAPIAVIELLHTPNFTRKVPVFTDRPLSLGDFM